jgi:hypothetical protein
VSELPCRRCSECDGHHHWQESLTANDEPGLVCKHCDKEITPTRCHECGGDLYEETRGRWCTDCDFEERVDAGKGGDS